MSKIVCVLVFALAFITISYGANPSKFQEYTQTLKLKFATQAEAKKAQVKFAPLPNNAKIAFSTRWDDSNPKHKIMSALLHKHGLKGNFYLNGWGNASIAQKALADGNAIGSHTISHPFLTTLTPNRISCEITTQKAILESELNTPVVAFVLPFCAYRSPVLPHYPEMIRNAILRAGFYVCPEPWADLAKNYKTTPDVILASHLFSANDSNPSEELFHKKIKLSTAKASKNKDVPHITFGLHTWQKEKGFETLGRCFDQYNKNPNWWYCNENEYGAYRYQYYHSKISETKVDGNTLIVKLTRIAPQGLGNNIPLELSVTPQPVKAKLDNKIITATNSNLYQLNHADKQRVPVSIEYFKNTKNLPLNKLSYKSKKFPEIEFGIFFENNKLKARIKNKSAQNMENIFITLRLPLKWKNGIVTSELATIIANQTKDITFDLGEIETAEDFQEYRLELLAQCDFYYNGKSSRIHAMTAVEQTKLSKVLPRDSVVSCGPLDKKLVTPELLAKLSEPNTKLTPLGKAANEQWAFSTNNEIYNKLTASIGYDRITHKQGFLLAAKCKNKARLSVLEFKIPKAAKMKLKIYRHNMFKSLYFNGKQLTKVTPTIELSAQKGLNRILFIDNFYSVKTGVSISLSSNDLSAEEIEYIRPAL